jgi:DNA-binding response OmpR family regulator
MGTALIVEDHPDQAQLVAKQLKLRDYEPVVAGTGATGLELARRLHPDVIVLDLMLPDINGFDVCRRLRSDRETMLTPVVMLTALSDMDNRIQGFRVGANAYVTKPYGIDELLGAIARVREWRSELEEGDIHGEIHVELDSEITLLQELNDFLMHLCRATPFAEEQVHQLRQAVMEMAQNAIEWGNQHASDRLVNITYRVYEDRVEIIVRDQGPGFDRANLPHAAAPDDPFSHLDVRDKLGLRAGGFGLMICRGMVDELKYNDLGNEVTLIKRFAQDATS